MSQGDTLDDKLDHTPLTFGVYKSYSPSEIAAYDPRYIVWLWENVVRPTPLMSELLYRDCLNGPRPQISYVQKKAWAENGFKGTASPGPSRIHYNPSANNMKLKNNFDSYDDYEPF